MFKTITRIGAAMLLTAGLASVQAQTYIPNTTFGGFGLNNPNLFANPSYVTIAPDGKIFVAEQQNDRISVWTQSGNTFGNLTTFGSNGSGASRFNRPNGIAITDDGKIFIADQYNNRISVWTMSGNTFGNLLTFGTNGSGSSNFSNPNGIIIANNGYIYIADQSNHRISVWTMSGNTFGNLTTFGLGTQGTASNQFQFPQNVAITTNGNILVADINNHRISVWTQSGNTFGNLTTFGGFGTAPDQLNKPVSITLDADGKIFIAEQDNYRISVWTQSGNTFSNLTTFGLGTSGNAANEFNNPTGISIAANGRIFVADQTNHRISVWNLCQEPTIVTQPSSIEVCEGDYEIIEVSATGSNLSYLWNNGKQTNSWFTSVAGSYMVTIAGACGRAISTAAGFTYRPTISGITLPAIVIVTVGGNSMVIIPTLSGSSINYDSKWVYGTNQITVVFEGNAEPNTKYTRPISPSRAIQIKSIIAADLQDDFKYQQKACPLHPFTVSNPMRLVDLSVIQATVTGISASANLSNTASTILVTILGLGLQNGADVIVGGVVLNNVSLVNGVLIGTIPAGSTVTNPNSPSIFVVNPNANTSAASSPTVVVVSGSTSLQTYQSTKFEIFPNPTLGEFSIAWQQPTVNYQLLTIYNAQGSVVYSQSIVSGSTVVNTNLQKGIYLVKVGTAVSKLVVE